MTPTEFQEGDVFAIFQWYRPPNISVPELDPTPVAVTPAFLIPPERQVTTFYTRATSNTRSIWQRHERNQAMSYELTDYHLFDADVHAALIYQELLPKHPASNTTFHFQRPEDFPIPPYRQGDAIRGPSLHLYRLGTEWINTDTQTRYEDLLVFQLVTRWQSVQPTTPLVFLPAPVPEPAGQEVKGQPLRTLISEPEPTDEELEEQSQIARDIYRETKRDWNA